MDAYNHALNTVFDKLSSSLHYTDVRIIMVLKGMALFFEDWDKGGIWQNVNNLLQENKHVKTKESWLDAIRYNAYILMQQGNDWSVDQTRDFMTKIMIMVAATSRFEGIEDSHDINAILFLIEPPPGEQAARVFTNKAEQAIPIFQKFAYGVSVLH
jgi:hypothetical protein